MSHPKLMLLVVALAAVLSPLALPAAEPVPSWLYPMAGKLPVQPYNTTVELRLADSKVTYTQAQLFDQFAVPDWHPDSHPPMPEVVAHGRRPEVFACGYCHLANGQGRPENASLAGLPSAYILQQLADFKSGARRSAWPGKYAPADSMVQVATNLSAADATAAAEYFSRLVLRQRAQVAQSATIPRLEVAAWTYLVVPGGQTEALGDRLLEFAPDGVRDERRDDQMQYSAYVPPGSIARGKTIATAGVSGGIACTTCHGADLRGMAVFPPIAGRSPTYILRQLYAFKNGTRHSAAAQPMVPWSHR
jgi:cytochrome c553